jgi:hypothetical protein
MMVLPRFSMNSAAATRVNAHSWPTAFGRETELYSTCRIGPKRRLRYTALSHCRAASREDSRLKE